MSIETMGVGADTLLSAAQRVEEARRELLHGDPETAAITLYELLREDPENAQAHEMLGVALIRTGRPNSGVAHLMRAVDLAPTSRTARFDLAIALNKVGKREAAKAELRRLIALDPGYTRAQQALAVLEGQDPRTAVVRQSTSGEECFRQPWEVGKPGGRTAWHA